MHCAGRGRPCRPRARTCRRASARRGRPALPAEHPDPAEAEFGATSSTAGSSRLDVGRHQPFVVRRRGNRSPTPEVAGRDPLVPRHPGRGQQRAGARQQHHLADRRRVVVAAPRASPTSANRVAAQGRRANATDEARPVVARRRAEQFTDDVGRPGLVHGGRPGRARSALRAGERDQAFLGAGHLAMMPRGTRRFR